MKTAWIQILLSLAIGFSLGITFNKFGGFSNCGKCISCACKKECKSGCKKDKSCCKSKCHGGCKSNYGMGCMSECEGKPCCKKMKEKMLAKFSSELSLTEDQKTKVKAIFESKHKEMVKIREELHPKFEALRKSTHDEINKILTPEQQKKFETMESKFGSFRKKHHGPDERPDRGPGEN